MAHQSSAENFHMISRAIEAMSYQVLDVWVNSAQNRAPSYATYGLLAENSNIINVFEQNKI
jgi:hypothetical protein